MRLWTDRIIRRGETHRRGNKALGQIPMPVRAAPDKMRTPHAVMAGRGLGIVT
jgi:hypothetical protein